MPVRCTAHVCRKTGPILLSYLYCMSCHVDPSCSSKGWHQISVRWYEGAIGPTKRPTAPLQSATGEILYSRDEQLRRWVEHFSLLYSQQNTVTKYKMWLVKADCSRICAQHDLAKVCPEIKCGTVFGAFSAAVGCLARQSSLPESAPKSCHRLSAVAGHLCFGANAPNPGSLHCTDCTWGQWYREFCAYRPAAQGSDLFLNALRGFGHFGT
jgi:hypothetical protein